MKTLRPEKEIREDLHKQFFAMHLRWEDWKEKANAGIQPHMSASATKYSACSASTSDTTSMLTSAGAEESPRPADSLYSPPRNHVNT
jgi:hypothetical protein